MARTKAPPAVTLLLALVLVACAEQPRFSFELIAVPTQSPGPFLVTGPQECPAALLEGTLITHDQAGLAVQNDDPLIPPSAVIWPNGWAARDIGSTRELLDGNGTVVAREGDRVRAGGGYGPPDDSFTPCGDITFTHAP